MSNYLNKMKEKEIWENKPDLKVQHQIKQIANIIWEKGRVGGGGPPQLRMIKSPLSGGGEELIINP